MPSQEDYERHIVPKEKYIDQWTYSRQSVEDIYMIAAPVIFLGFGGFILAFFSVGIFGVVIPTWMSVIAPAILGGLFGLGVVTAAPNHVITTRWLSDMFGYIKQPQRIYAASREADPAERNEGGIMNHEFLPFEPDMRTQDLTNIKFAWSGAQAVQRKDGRVEAIIEFGAENRDFAEEGEWRADVRTAKKWSNEYLPDHVELKFHGVTRPFNPDQVIEGVEEQLENPDLAGKPVLRELLKEMKEQRPEELRNRKRPKFYYIVSVSPSEISEYSGSSTAKENLRRSLVFGNLLQIGGWLATKLGVSRSSSSEESTNTQRRSQHAREEIDMPAENEYLSIENEQEVLDELEKRVREVEENLITEIAFQTNSRRLSTVEIFTLGMRFWSGPDSQEQYENVEKLIQSETPDTAESVGTARSLARYSAGAAGLAGSALAPIVGQVPGPYLGPVPLAPIAGIILTLALLYKLFAQDSVDQGRDVPQANVSNLVEGHRETHGIGGNSIGETGPDRADGIEEDSRTLADISAEHQNLMAPAEVENDSRIPRLGDGTFIKTLVVTSYPEFPKDGFLSELFKLDVDLSLTAYCEPVDSDLAKSYFKREADDLSAESDMADGAEEDERRIAANSLKETRKAIDRGNVVADLSVYITIRAGDREEIQRVEERVQKVLARDPANVNAETYPGKALESLQSGSPIGRDVLGLTDPDRFKVYAVSGAIGALFTSPEDPTFIEEGGFEMGEHRQTRLPMLVDPFEREDGHALGIFGVPGSGKSRSAKDKFLSLTLKRDDVIGVVIEPVGNWTGVINAAQIGTGDGFEAEHIVVGGDQPVNPLAINGIPEDQWDQMPDGADPLGERKEAATVFVKNFLNLRDQDLGDYRSVWEEALNDAYHNAGFRHDDWSTHFNEDITFPDVLAELAKRADPEQAKEFALRHESEAEDIQESAQKLLRMLAPLDAENRPESQYAAFGRQSDLDFQGKDMIYLDLGRQEGNPDNKGILTMSTLISQVYELAKVTDKKLIVAMDEFKYLLDESLDFSFINQLFRHMRHNEISPWLMTQTIDEFKGAGSDEEEATGGKEILSMLTMQEFHYMPEVSQWGRDVFDMSDAVAEIGIEQATPGSESIGYADAVAQVDGEWWGLEVRTPVKRTDVIEFDPGEDTFLDLPGVDKSLLNDIDATAAVGATGTETLGDSGSEVDQATPDLNLDEQRASLSGRPSPEGDNQTDGTAEGGNGSSDRLPASADTAEETEDTQTDQSGVDAAAFDTDRAGDVDPTSTTNSSRGRNDQRTEKATSSAAGDKQTLDDVESDTLREVADPSEILSGTSETGDTTNNGNSIDGGPEDDSGDDQPDDTPQENQDRTTESTSDKEEADTSGENQQSRQRRRRRRTRSRRTTNKPAEDDDTTENEGDGK